MSEENITIKKDVMWKVGTFVFAILFVVSLFTGGFGIGKSTGQATGNVVANGNNIAANNQPGVTEAAKIEIGDAPVTGSANAPVTIVEFSDFSCPFCAAASGDNKDMVDYMKSNSPSWEPAVTNIMNDYVKTGKVKFAVKYSYGHTGGHPAQSVAWCLNDQSSALFWKFYPQAFANQKDVEDLNKMKALAKTVGADTTKLQTCLDSKKYDGRFDKEQAEGTAAGVQGTPAFFVNGKLISGAQPYSVFKQAIDAELA